MVAHDAKVVNGEGVLFFQEFDVVQEEKAHGSVVEDHLATVDSGGDMVDGIGFQVSVLPHTVYTGLRCVALRFLEKKVCVPMKYNEI